jgi:hypothetical protein
MIPSEKLQIARDTQPNQAIFTPESHIKVINNITTDFLLPKESPNLKKRSL